MACRGRSGAEFPACGIVSKQRRFSEHSGFQNSGEGVPNLCSRRLALPVGLIQDEPPDAAEMNALGGLDVVHQAARSGDQNVDSFAQSIAERKGEGTVAGQG